MSLQNMVAMMLFVRRDWLILANKRSVLESWTHCALMSDEIFFEMKEETPKPRKACTLEAIPMKQCQASLAGPASSRVGSCRPPLARCGVDNLQSQNSRL